MVDKVLVVEDEIALQETLAYNLVQQGYEVETAGDGKATIDTARSGGSTGLGLAIARHLAEAHGGQIWAESIEGQGSTFYFNIPIVK